MKNTPEIDSKIKNIRLTLYAFQLREDANEGYQNPAKNAEDLWKNLQIVAEQLNLDTLPDTLEKIANQLKSNPPLNEWENLLHLLENQPNFIKLSQKTPKDYPLKGSFRAQKVQDLYLAELSLLCQDKTTQETAISTDDLTPNFNPEGCLLPPTIKTTFGQTILLYAEPVDFSNYRQLADDCVTSLIQDYLTQKPEFVNQGKLLDSPIFEYQNSPSDRNLEPGENCHILVWLKHSENTVNNITKEFELYLRNLLLYQHKVFYAYHQGRYHYIQGQERANHLEKKIPEFAKISQETEQKTRLQNYRELLKKVLTEGFEYRKSLRHLQECHNTIRINIGNFSTSLEEIKKVKFSEDNLELWESFLTIAQNKYQKQLEGDINYLIAGQNLFQEMVATIRANLEIEQIEIDRKSQEQEAENSRNLNITIGVFGAGMASAGVVATSYALIKPEQPLRLPWDPNTHTLHPFISSVFWSLFFGFIVAVGILILIKKGSFKNNKP